MSVLGSLSIKLGIVTQGFDTSINNAKSKVNDLGSAVGNVNKLLGAFGVSLGLAGAIQGVRTVIDFADQVDDLGKAFDLSTSKVLQFRDALGQSGGKAENAERILGQLFDKIETARNSMVTDDIAKQFAKLGLSIQDLKTMQPEQALTAVFNGLSKIGNTYERTAMVKDLLGKNGIGLDVKNLATIMSESDAAFSKNAESIKTIAEAADMLARAFENLKLKGAEILVSTTKFNFAGLKDALRAGYTQEEIDKMLAAAGYGGFGQTHTTAGLMGMTTMPGATFDNVQTGGQGQFNLMGGGLFGQPSLYKPLQTPQIKVGVAQKDLIDKDAEASAKRLANLKAELELTKRLTEVQTAQGKLDIDALTADKDIIAMRQAKLELTKAEAEAQRKLEDNLKNAAKNEKEIAAAQQLHNAEVAQANALYQNKINLINASWELQKQEMITQTQSQESFEFGWKSAFMAYAEDARNAAQLGGDIFNSVTNRMGSAIDSFVQTGKFSFKDFANSVIQDILRIMMRWQMMQIVMGVMGAFRGGASVNTDTISSDYVSPGGIVDLSNPNLPRRASGGMLDRPSIVGENGAELFIPNRPGTIIPNARMGDFMGNQPQMVVNGTYIAQMSAIDTQSAQQFLAKNRQSVFAANQSAMRGLPAGR